jgi:hypothetical protein
MVKVSFITDIEGNWEYLLHFVEISEALRNLGINEDGSLELELLDGWTFVHGGDCPDKGNEVGGSIRIVRTLLRLKAKYPERVVLLLGNRDINKIRLSSELAPSQLEPARLATIPGPFWVPEAKRATPLSFVNTLAAAEFDVPVSQLTEAQRQQHNTLANRIRYLLKDTMGSQGEFERRQAELTLLQGRPATEAETCASFVESAQPGGFMHALLSEGALAAVRTGPATSHRPLATSHQSPGCLCRQAAVGTQRVSPHSERLFPFCPFCLR